ncbi:hypothetical protein [Anaeromicrobium sediminis]|nr:hypothetical protein [Anaeromicrobium sediminis]
MEKTTLKFNENIFNFINEKRENNNMDKIKNSIFDDETAVKIKQVKY